MLQTLTREADILKQHTILNISTPIHQSLLVSLFLIECQKQALAEPFHFWRLLYRLMTSNPFSL